MSDPHLEDRRQSDGKFGPGTTSETDIDLDGGELLDLDEIAARHGQATADRCRSVLDQLDTDAEREFYAGAVNDLILDMGPDQVRLMTDAGYGPADISLAREKRLLTKGGAITGSIPPVENLRALAGSPVMLRHSLWMDESIAAADPGRLHKAVTASKVSVDAIVELTDSKRADDLRSGAAAGLSLPVIESGHSVESMVSIKKANPKADAMGLAARGHDGDSVKAYGVTACQSYTKETLDETGLPGKTIRSFASAGVPMNAWQDYADAGLNGKQAKMLRGHIAPESTPAQHAQMAKAVSVERLDAWRSKMSKSFSLEDVENIRDCEQAGYTPDRLGKMTSADSGYARECNEESGNALATFSSWAKAGITDDEARRFSRAGVPPSQFADVKASGQDPWEVGANRRKRYEAASWNGRREWPYERP